MTQSIAQHLTKRAFSRGFAAAALAVLLLTVHSADAASLVSYWSFDESASGTDIATDSQGGNNGTFNGNTVRTDGLIGVGAAFYPGNNPAGVNVGTSLSFTTGMAIEAMVTSPNWDGNGYEEVFRKEDGGNRILFSLQFGSILSTGFNGGGGYSEFDVVLDGTGDKLTVAEFASGTHHLVTNYNSATGLQELYIDGVLQASRVHQAGPNMISGGGAAGFIGASNGGESWDGVIDEVALYSEPLTTDEIAAHYANVQAGRDYFTDVPEPSTLVLASLGLLGLIGMGRRRKRS